MNKLNNLLAQNQQAAEKFIQTVSTSTLPLEQIKQREADTRSLNPNHVSELAESIAAIGLIQPLAVDRNGVLLAGGHRLAAIEQLQSADQKSFDKWFSSGVPVHRFEIDALAEQDLALAIEVSENERRRDYSPKEVRSLAEKLKAAGYVSKRGGKKKGSKALVPELELIVGKSRRTIERYLSPETVQMNPTNDAFSKDVASTERSLKRLLKHDNLPDRIAELAGALKDELESLNLD